MGGNRWLAPPANVRHASGVGRGVFFRDRRGFPSIRDGFAAIGGGFFRVGDGFCLLGGGFWAFGDGFSASGIGFWSPVSVF